MKKVITPFLFGLMLAVSSAAIFADSSNDGKTNLSSVLGGYDRSGIQFLTLAENSQPIFQDSTKNIRCMNLCSGEKDWNRCMKICLNS
ncbi:MAG: hypothetical protein WCI06_01850 [Methylococcaceae bacterium]